MATNAQRIADLEHQVAELAAEVKILREEAFALRTYEEIRAMRAGWQPPPPAQGRRPRHLQAVQAIT